MEHNPQESSVELCTTCSAACPVHTDTREYVQCITRGDYERALDVLLQVNPFSSVCGFICHHPCESECRRKAIDSPVSLRQLKRFVVENTREHRVRSRTKASQTTGKKVAIIGSGPAGLTAAKDLAFMGHRVTVFDKQPVLGGMLANAIPRYRLPLDALFDDIEDILAAGVEARTNCEVGKDLSFDQLRKDYDAILISVGLAESSSLPIPGIESKGVLLGIPFLWDTANGFAPKIGDRVLVVGGGNVAIDVARTAKRLGPSSVYLACLESREEMPAWKWEIQEAEEEGIVIMNSWGPKAILFQDGKTTGIEFRRCTQVFDENRRFSPRYDESETTTVEVETVILTIGQRANLDFIRGTPVAVDGGRLVFDRETLRTSEAGVFASGEVITGPGSAVQAVASGHNAARVMDHYLKTGEVMKLEPESLETIGELSEKTAERAKKSERMEVGLPTASDRIKNFSPIERAYSEGEALAEARRCLACATGAVLDSTALCAGCLTCVRICPYGVATVDQTAFMPAKECLTCGLCAAECPAAGIRLARFATNNMKETLADILKQTDLSRISKPFVVSYCCLYETTSRKYLKQQAMKEIEESGILKIMVPCVGRLGSIDLLTPFELGADRVAVIACKENGCAFTGAEELFNRRIKGVRHFLDEIKVGQNNLLFFHTRGNAEESWPEIWEEARKETVEASGAGSGS